MHSTSTNTPTSLSHSSSSVTPTEASTIPATSSLSPISHPSHSISPSEISSSYSTSSRSPIPSQTSLLTPVSHSTSSTDAPTTSFISSTSASISPSMTKGSLSSSSEGAPTTKSLSSSSSATPTDASISPSLTTFLTSISNSYSSNSITQSVTPSSFSTYISNPSPSLTPSYTPISPSFSPSYTQSSHSISPSEFASASTTADMSKSSSGLSVNMLKELISSLEKQKAELEEKVEALSSIQNKISEITGKARSDDETHTCSEFVSLLEVFLQSIVNGTDNWRSMITEIVSSSVGPCTTEDLENLENTKDATEAYSKDIEDEIINIADRIEKLNTILALRASSEPTTQITSTIVSTTILSKTGKITNNFISFLSEICDSKLFVTTTNKYPYNICKCCAINKFHIRTQSHYELSSG